MLGGSSSAATPLQTTLHLHLLQKNVRLSRAATRSSAEKSERAKEDPGQRAHISKTVDPCKERNSNWR